MPTAGDIKTLWKKGIFSAFFKVATHGVIKQGEAYSRTEQTVKALLLYASSKY